MHQCAVGLLIGGGSIGVDAVFSDVMPSESSVGSMGNIDTPV
jgi:hypothetical protein